MRTGAPLVDDRIAQPDPPCIVGRPVRSELTDERTFHFRDTCNTTILFCDLPGLFNLFGRIGRLCAAKIVDLDDFATGIH